MIFRHNLFCDVSLVVGMVEIIAHKMVLAACSVYFYAMFVEFGENHQQHVVIEGVDAQSLRTIVEYVYTSCLEITEDNVQQLLSAADLLQITDVRAACCDFLQTQLHPTNCLGIRAFADLHGCVDLVAAADLYAAQHFTEVAEEKEILSLNLEQFTRLLESERLTVTNQEPIFECIVRWVRAGSEGNVRSTHFFDLIKLVRLPLLSQHYLVHRVSEESLVKADPRCNQLLIEALTGHLLSNEGQVSTLAQSLVLLVVGGYSSIAEYYNFQQGRWQQVADIPTSRYGAGLAVLNNRAYVVGGSNNKSVYVYDPATNSWSQSVSMGTHRRFHGVTVLDDCIYAVGGLDSDSYALATVEKYDNRQVATPQWTQVASMKTRRCGVGVGVLNGVLYAVGGRDSRQKLSSVECYNPTTDHWENVPSMNVCRWGVGVGVLAGELYAVGGQDDTKTDLKCVEAYCPQTGTWRRVSDMATPRLYAGVITYHGRLYVVGGSRLTSVEVYDPQTDTWTMLAAEMTVKRATACVGLISKPD